MTLTIQENERSYGQNVAGCWSSYGIGRTFPGLRCGSTVKSSDATRTNTIPKLPKSVPTGRASSDSVCPSGKWRGSWPPKIAGAKTRASVLVDKVGLKVLETSRARTYLEESLRYADRNLLTQKKQFDALAAHMDKTRKARHYLQQHLTVVKSYLEHDDKAGLAEYIELYQSHLPPGT